jgi:hypothetical protein
VRPIRPKPLMPIAILTKNSLRPVWSTDMPWRDRAGGRPSEHPPSHSKHYECATCTSTGAERGETHNSDTLEGAPAEQSTHPPLLTGQCPQPAITPKPGGGKAVRAPDLSNRCHPESVPTGRAPRSPGRYPTSDGTTASAQVKGIESLRWPRRTGCGIAVHSRPDFDHPAFRWSTGASTIQTPPRPGFRQTIRVLTFRREGAGQGSFGNDYSPRSGASQSRVPPQDWHVFFSAPVRVSSARPRDPAGR